MLKGRNNMKNKPNYKTWIRINKLIIFIVITFFMLILVFLPINIFIRISAGFFALPFIYISFILIYSYYQLSGSGKDYQAKIHQLIVEKISFDKKESILEIGAGSGALAIKLAKKFPASSVIGIDNWGKNWTYSKEQCENNAKIENIEKIKFIKASASKLPFQNHVFDVVVSCLTFHEVQDQKNKVKLIEEALRIIKPNGKFIFLDLFLDKKIFGNYDNLISAIQSMNVTQIKIEKLDALLYLPPILRHKKVLGNAVAISGSIKP